MKIFLKSKIRKRVPIPILDKTNKIIVASLLDFDPIKIFIN